MKRTKKQRDLEPIFLSSGILLLIFSLFIPIPVIIFSQELLFYRTDTLSLIRHDEAFRGMAAAIAWLGVVSLSAYATVIYADKKRTPYRLKGIHFLVATLAIPLALFSIWSYSAIDQNQVRSHHFGHMEGQVIEFKDVQKIIRHYEPNPTRVTSISFVGETNTITVPYNAEDGKTVRAVRKVIDIYQFEVEDNF